MYMITSNGRKFTEMYIKHLIAPDSQLKIAKL
jgi:hypothetical protein